MYATVADPKINRLFGFKKAIKLSLEREDHLIICKCPEKKEVKENNKSSTDIIG